MSWAGRQCGRGRQPCHIRSVASLVPSRQERGGHWDQSGWGPTEVNIKEGCIGTFHEDFFGGAVERLVHKVDTVSDHGSDPLSKALWGRKRRLRWGQAPPDSLTLPARSFPKRFLSCTPVLGPGTTLSPILSVRFELASSCSQGLNCGCPRPGSAVEVLTPFISERDCIRRQAFKGD